MEIKIIEYAPKIFRNIRKKICSEKLIFDSFKPSDNINAMHNFQRGQGKSASLFLFTDNKALMIKTLKKKEVDVLFDP